MNEIQVRERAIQSHNCFFAQRKAINNMGCCLTYAATVLPTIEHAGDFTIRHEVMEHRVTTFYSHTGSHVITAVKTSTFEAVA